MKANRAYTDAEDIDDEIIETQIAVFDGFCQMPSPRFRRARRS
jgi:hypothetical protein